MCLLFCTFLHLVTRPYFLCQKMVDSEKDYLLTPSGTSL